MAKSIRRAVDRMLAPIAEMLEARRMLTAVALTGTSGADDFVVSYDPSTLQYSFSGGTATPAAIAASDFNSFTLTGDGGADTLTIEGGNPTLSNDGGADGTSLAVTVDTGATLSFYSTEHLSSLTVQSGAVAQMLSSGSNVLETSSLALDGSTDDWDGQLDLTNNDLIVHNSNSTTAAASLATITDQLKSGFNGSGGYWTGEGIASTAAAASTNTALGVELNNNGSGGTFFSTFAGQSVVNTDVLIKYTFAGDANLDGAVNAADYLLIDSNFNGGGTLPGWRNGDFNYDGLVNGDDYTLIDNAFNSQQQQPLQFGPPQPTGLTIIQAITGEFDMQWNPSPDPSVASYNVYAGTDPSFLPSANDQIASDVIQNGYSDYFTADPSLTWYYKITAVNSSGTESLPSAASVGASMPASTSDDYTDAPDSSTPPDSSYDVDSDGNQVDDDAIAKPTADSAGGDLVAFYGAGSITAFGNIHFRNIVASLGGTVNSTKDSNGLGVAYRDWQMNAALTDLLASLDTNGDMTISAAEIAAQSPITVLGYSWGAVEAVNFTRMLSAPNPHLLGSRRMGGNAKRPTIFYTGGYNLTEAVPIKTLETIDPVLHAVLGLSGLIKTTDGPLANVVTFRNYYEQRGGTTVVEQFLGGANGIDEGPDSDFTIGNFFSSGIMGNFLDSQAQNGTAGEIDVTTSLANLNTFIPYRMDAEGDIIYGRLKGSQVQHDTMPFYLQQMVINDLANG